MNVGSVFSGIGGLDEGLRRAGHQHVFFCESDARRRDVLRARFPGVPVFDDVGALGKPAWGVATDAAGASVDLGRWEAGTGLLCGGFPCQDLSVAGRRAGLAGDRSGLFFEFARIAESLRPGWLLVENVPGLLSSNGGRDFGVVLGTLADIGYGVAWRIVDSRFFGVPQRRRRVFIVGAFADGDPRAAAERAGEVLAVGQGCARHLAPRGQAGQDVASPLGGSVGKGRGHDGNPFDRGGHSSLSGLGSGGPDDNDAQAGRLVVSPALVNRYGKGTDSDATDALIVANTLKSQRGRGGGGIGPEETLVAQGSLPTDSRIAEEIAPTLQAAKSEARGGTAGPLIAAPLTKGSATGEGVNAPGRRQEDDVNLVTSITLASDPISAQDIAQPSTRRNGDPGVRRLTPTECERLQGFPDGWTQLGDTPDSRRYSALGDAVTVNVSEWIGRRLAP